MLDAARRVLLNPWHGMKSDCREANVNPTALFLGAEEHELIAEYVKSSPIRATIGNENGPT